MCARGSVREQLDNRNTFMKTCPQVMSEKNPSSVQGRSGVSSPTRRCRGTAAILVLDHETPLRPGHPSAKRFPTTDCRPRVWGTPASGPSLTLRLEGQRCFSPSATQSIIVIFLVRGKLKQATSITSYNADGRVATVRRGDTGPAGSLARGRPGLVGPLSSSLSLTRDLSRTSGGGRLKRGDARVRTENADEGGSPEATSHGRHAC